MPIQKRELRNSHRQKFYLFSLIRLKVMTASKRRLDNTLLVLRRRQPALRSLDQATRCLAHRCQQKHLLQNLSITSSGLSLQSLSSYGINTRRHRNWRSQGDVGRTRRKEGGWFAKRRIGFSFHFAVFTFSPLLYLSLRNLYHLHTAHASVASKREGAFFDKFDLELCDRSKPCNRFLSLNTQLLPIATFSCSRFQVSHYR